MPHHDLPLAVSDEDDDPRRRAVRWALLVVTIVTISVFHYRTPPEFGQWHVVYQRLYYLPTDPGEENPVDPEAEPALAATLRAVHDGVRRLKKRPPLRKAERAASRRRGAL